eukprot:CAMPEP_0114680936 /NCGR_PEP_ID=MMETSP0191-20121206/54761_1 /TAXON_ID=126664 /ORGANISM="Sorites sp." /LENGTH=35 /DNA_ID= /DNA_START= /DNA_END= /DNA_ORIENTATION=
MAQEMAQEQMTAGRALQTYSEPVSDFRAAAARGEV